MLYLRESVLSSGWILQKAKSDLTFNCDQLPIHLLPCSTISPVTDANILFKNVAEVLFTYSTNLSWPQAYNYKDNWDKAHYWATISSWGTPKLFLSIFPHLFLVGTCSCLCIQACPSLGFASLLPRERGRWRHCNRPWTGENVLKLALEK